MKPQLRPDVLTGFTQVVGVGGIGTGTHIALHGNQTLGRNESRMGEWIDARDYCKLHIMEHYIAALLDANTNHDDFKVFAVGNIGDDISGANLLREMVDVGIDTRYVRVELDRPTLFSFAFSYPDKSGGNITVSNSAACKLGRDQLAECRNVMQQAGRRGIALCLPEVPLDARSQFLRIATKCENLRVASFTAGEMENARQLTAHVDLLALNQEEAIAFADKRDGPQTEQQWLDAVSQMANTLNPEIKLIVSAGAAGAHVLQNGAWSKHKALPVEPIATAGAGDAMLAGVIAGLAAGLPLVDPAAARNTHRSAIDLGLALAAFSITSPHTIHPGISRHSFLAFAAEHGMQIA